MKMAKYEEEIDKMIEKFPLKKYEKEKKYILKNSIKKFIQNGNNIQEQEYILNMVKNISWYWDMQIAEYLESETNKYFDSETIIVDCATGEKKNEYSNSAINIYTLLANSGYFNDSDFIKISNLNELDKNIKRLIILDDFIGSGDTILKQIKKIIDYGFTKKEIIIISYICHESGKNNIENFVTDNNINLKYEVLENTYLKKGLDYNLVKYINKICKKCKKRELRYGYGNCGSMVSINLTSPNNNLPILYGKNIDGWDSLLDRNLNLIVLQERKNKAFIENKNIVHQFYVENFKDIISYDEYKLILMLYNCFGIDEILLNEFHIYGTIDEIKKVIESLKTKKIIKDEYYLSIENKSILNKLRNLDLAINKEFTKKINRKFY